MKVNIKQLLASTELDRKVTVRGWIKNKRGNKHVGFLVINDGSCFNNIQVRLIISS